MSWTDERCAELRRLLSDGLTYTEIAVSLGGDVTRNACIGKAKRLGISNGRHSTDSRSGRPRRQREPKTPVVKRPPVKRLTRTISPYHFRYIEMEEHPVMDLPACDIPIAQRKQLHELKFLDCRWPYGDPGTPNFFFCGGERAGGSYCAIHARIAYKAGRILSAEEHARRSASARRRSTEAKPFWSGGA